MRDGWRCVVDRLDGARDNLTPRLDHWLHFLGDKPDHVQEQKKADQGEQGCEDYEAHVLDS